MGEKLMYDTKTSDVNDRVMEDHDAGIGPSADDMETHNPDTDDLTAAIERDLATPEEAKNTEGTAGDKTGEKGSDDTKGPVPYDRFQELVTEKNSLKERIEKTETESRQRIDYLEAQLRTLTSILPRQEPGQEKLPFDDILAQEDEQKILDALQEAPKDFVKSLLARATIDARRNIERAAIDHKRDSDIQSGLDEFGKKHTDFVPSIEKIKEIVKGNPIHNAVSAYAVEILLPRMEAEHKKEIEALKEAHAKELSGAKDVGRKEAIKQVRAKGNAAVLDGSSATGSRTAVDPAIVDTNGDTRSALTARLLARRQAKG